MGKVDHNWDTAKSEATDTTAGIYNYIVLALWFSSVAKIAAYRPQVADFKDICVSFLFKLRIHIRTQTSSSIPSINQLYTQ
jgi:hypothetical protein